MRTSRPIRFGFTGGASSKRERLLDSAHTVGALGYSTFGLADHDRRHRTGTRLTGAA